MQISAVVLTKNEENTIADCLESLLFCDQIVVVDDESTDKTIDIIKQMDNPKIHLRRHELDNNYANQRNYAMSEAKGDWILFIDADERVSEELANEIKSVVSTADNAYNGFYLKRDDYLWGEKMQKGETGNIKLLRLVRKDTGKWQGKVHEVLTVNGTVGLLRHPIIHYPHENITEFLKKINNYSTIRAEELYENKVKTNLLLIILYPKLKFIKNYFFLSGYKDGIPGFVHAVLMSFHSFMVRGKLYLLWKGIKNT